MKSRSIGALLTLMLTAWPIAAAPGSESGAAAPAWLSDPFVAFAIGDQTRTSIPDSQSETSTVYLYAVGWTRAQALANLETIVGLEMNARSAVFTGTRTFTCQGGWWAIVSTLIIENGSADAYASDRIILIGLAMTSKDPNKLAIADQYFSYEPYGLMVRRGDADFRLAVNRVLARLYRSGEIIQIYERWFGPFDRTSNLLQSMYLLYSLPE